MSQEIEGNELDGETMATMMEEAPNDLELELEEQLAKESMESLFGESMQNFKEGEVVAGKVMEISDDRILVDIGYKSEGVVPRGEFTHPVNFSVGETFDFYIEDPENDQGMPILSKLKADRIKNWEKVQEIYERDGVIEGVITRRVKGGLKVDIGVDAFMPASQLTFRPTGDLERYIGQKIELKIIKLTKRRRNVVVSRRKLLEEQRADEKHKLLTTIEVGQDLKGEVKNITDFGAFVDVGGIDGLLHVTDMSWGRVKHPSQVVHVGQEITVKVLSFDPKSERISLGLKQNTENPWKSVAERYPVGGVTRGRIVSMTDYGAFVQIEDGVEGMVHVSEMSWTRRVRHPNELLDLDQDVDVMVLSVDAEAEKIALGIKQTLPNPWHQLRERYPIDSVVKGTVRNLTDYGAFVQIEDGIDGLLHVSDLSWTKKITHPSEVIEKGQELDVKILSIDPEAEKISVGLKQLETDPWLALVEQLPLGAHVEVEIAKLVSFGAFARLENGIEGLIHVSELSAERVHKPEEVLAIGDKVTAKVINLDPVERKIGLSVREYQRDLDKSLMDDHGGEKSEGGSVDVNAALRGAVPENMLQAGRSLAEMAQELMSSVSAAESARAVEATGEASAPVAPQVNEEDAGANESAEAKSPAPEAPEADEVTEAAVDASPDSSPADSDDKDEAADAEVPVVEAADEGASPVEVDEPVVEEVPDGEAAK